MTGCTAVADAFLLLPPLVFLLVHPLLLFLLLACISSWWPSAHLVAMPLIPFPSRSALLRSCCQRRLLVLNRAALRRPCRIHRSAVWPPRRATPRRWGGLVLGGHRGEHGGRLKHLL
jgi:hypothetical protein